MAHLPQTSAERPPRYPAILGTVLHASGAEMTIAPSGGPAEPVVARCALPPGVVPAEGDEVVVVATRQGPIAVGVVGAPRAQLKLADGTQVRAAPDGATLEVQRADGTSLFRYDVHDGHGRITLQSEGIALDATGGDLDLRAAGDVRIQGRSVHTVARMAGAQHEAALHLTPREARLSGGTLRLRSGELDVDAEKTAVRSAEVRGDLGRAVVRANRLETVAEVVVQQARNLYQRVQELAQQRAGSVRTIVEETVQLKAKEVMHWAATAYKVRSDKIHLG